VILFAKAKREQGEPLFTLVEKGIFSCVIVGAGLAAYGLYSGLLSL
jgi:arginine:ornithine antiporter/lysine permease